MKTISTWTTALLLLSGAVYAQDPSTNDTSDPYGNTGMGTGALISVTPGTDVGDYNTASGYNALNANTTGYYNTATGSRALFTNTDGGFNTATGLNALQDNTSGANNTATGNNALYSNAVGSYNTATGAEALFDNTGSDNTATGYEALAYNSTGSWNTASGYRALYNNSTGSNNTAAGIAALKANTTGSNNIAMGKDAGLNVTTGSNNIEIGNEGTASDNNLILIGTEGTQAKTFIAGIYNTSVTGNAVMVNSSGQLGVVVSSERFKTAVAPMGTNSAKLQRLRPVTFKLKTDPNGAVQYGLIAEEVAKVYPELIVRDQNGRIDGVRYDELAPMLLNEVQKQQQTIAAQAAQLRDIQRQLAEMRAALVTVQSKDQLVAQR